MKSVADLVQEDREQIDDLVKRSAGQPLRFMPMMASGDDEHCVGILAPEVAMAPGDFLGEVEPTGGRVDLEVGVRARRTIAYAMLVGCPAYVFLTKDFRIDLWPRGGEWEIVACLRTSADKVTRWGSNRRMTDPGELADSVQRMINAIREIVKSKEN